ncbi:MAG: alpha/beta hydrolase [Bacteroidota bacterium]
MIFPNCHANGKVIRIYDFGNDSALKRNIDIWLPDDYPAAEHYNVLYMHDGQMLFDSADTWNHQEWMLDETASSLIKEGFMKPVIIVGIWNGGSSRHADYFPQKPFEILDDSVRKALYEARRPEENSVFQKHRIRSDTYLEFIVKELMPYIDSNFSTIQDRNSTFIGGSSMGGLISWYAACEYPEVFGGAICMSTHWPGIFLIEKNPIPDAFIDYLKNNLPQANKTKFYFDRGTVGLDAFYEPFQKSVDSLFISKGYDEENFMSRDFKGADHNEKAWSERLSIPLLFMMGSEK